MGVSPITVATTAAGGKKKRKNESRAQKALNAMADELADLGVALPSTYHSKIRQHPDMRQAVQTELALREGQADEALDELRLHIATFESLEKRKRQGSGIRHNTVLDGRLQKKRQAQHRAKDRYRALRDIMLVLGMPNDHKKFRILNDEDLRAFTLTTVEQQLGDSYRLPSWIWGDFSFVNQVKAGEMRSFLEASMRVHWFKHNALTQRWTEELKTRREEIFRSAVFFADSEREWCQRAAQREEEGRRGAAAYARR
ncbi:hypothetical protein BD311DRAFT_657411 [Dichomitus squalens]|uniref:Uncharacterized protein n=2 Tax=Dichomitus squalens TaxID=114155 RepID=A0A4Q9MT96_9APHY|nr:hypothetical protein BD311DRAFT_657411 [Dichomitus squalens]